MNMMQPQQFPPQSKELYKKYNDFENMPNMMNNYNNQMNPSANNRFNTYNNFPPQMQNPMMNNFPQQTNDNIDEEEEDVLAGRIYDLVEQYQPKLAGKITGMIKGTGVNQMKDLLKNQRDLKNVIDEAIVLIGRDTKK